MGYRRLDDQFVQDDMGNTMWLPDLFTMPDPGPGRPPPNALIPPDFSTPPALPQGPLPAIQPRSPEAIQAAVEAATPPTGGIVDPFGPPPSIGSTDTGAASPTQRSTPGPGPRPSAQPPPAKPPKVPGIAGEPPKDPGIQVPTLGPEPRNPAEADAAVTDAVNQQTRTGLQAADAEIKAQREAAQREADALAQSTKDWDTQKAARDKVYADYAAKADQETADWLKQQQELASKEPDRHRFWHESSGFSKAMWLIGLAASSIGAGADQSKNVALKMLTDAIDEDVASQRDAIARKMQAGAAAGQAMKDRQARDLGKIHDDDAAYFQRWASVRDQALAMAKAPGSAAQQAAYAKVADAAGQRVFEVAQAKAQQKHQEAQAAANRQVQYAELAYRKINDQANRQQQQAQFETTIKKDYDLAQMSVDARVAAAEAAGKAKVAPLDPALGFSMVDRKSGITLPIPISEDQKDKAGALAASIGSKANLLARARDAISNMSTTEWMANSSVEGTSAMYEAAREFAREQNNGNGRMAKDDVDDAFKELFGVDVSSVTSKAKADGREAIAAMLQKRLDDLPKEAQHKMAQFGWNIPAGADIVYQIPKLTEPRAKEMGPEETLAAQGAVLQAPSSPKSGGEYLVKKLQDARNPGTALPKLPAELGSIVDSAVAAAGNSPAHALDYRQQALEALKAYETRAANIQNDQARAKALELAADARIRLEHDLDVAATATRGKINDAVEVAGTLGITDPEELRDYLRKTVDVGSKEGLILSPQDLDVLVKQANKVLRDRYGGWGN